MTTAPLPPSPVVLHDPLRLPAGMGPIVVAIGNFDGVHLGHRAVLRAGLARARTLQARFFVLTFAPHPRKFFRPEAPLFLLTPGELQTEALAEAGAPNLIRLTFDAALAATGAEDFVQNLLLERLNVVGVAVGEDFHFGRGRLGSPEFLRLEGARRGFSVDQVAPVVVEGEIASSSAIRAALAEGEPARARALLGRAYRIRGTVLHGQKLGRTLGYPTANLRLPEECGLKQGIYAVRLRHRGAWHDGVASFGRRPTFDNGAPLLEVHAFAFSGDLYGAEVDVAFHAYLRGEAKFDGVDALIAQMHQDSAAAHALLAHTPAEPAGGFETAAGAAISAS